MDVGQNNSERENLLREITMLRELLCMHHGHEGIYGDDGELQCFMGGCHLDYKRDNIDKIAQRLSEQDMQHTSRLYLLQKQIELSASNDNDRCKSCGQAWVDNQHYCTALHDWVGKL